MCAQSIAERGRYLPSASQPDQPTQGADRSIGQVAARTYWTASRTASGDWPWTPGLLHGHESVQSVHVPLDRSLILLNALLSFLSLAAD